MRHFKSGLAPLIALLALAIACAPAPPPAEEAAPGTHADLLQLFEEFRVFQEPEIVDGVPDYTAEAMEAQRQELEDYKSRLAAIDISEWTDERARLPPPRDRIEEALRECNALVGRFGSEADAEMEGLVMRAISWRAMLFANTSRLEDSLAEFDSLEKRLRGRDLTEVDEGIPKAFLLKGTILTALGRPDAARRVYDNLLKGTDVPGPAKTLKAHVQLAQAQLELDSHNYGMASKAASYVLGDRRDQPPEIRCRALLIRVQASASADPAASSKDLATALDVLPTLDRFPQEVLSALMTASLDLGVAHVLELIERSSSCDLLLPFKTALDIELGNVPRVAREVEEVAKDIWRALAELRCRRATNTHKSSKSEGVS